MPEVPPTGRSGRHPDRRGDRFTYDPTTGDPVVDVVEAVATYLNTDPLAIEPQLGAVFDCDALDVLLTNAADGVEVCFEFGPCHVVVTSGGEIFVDDA